MSIRKTSGYESINEIRAHIGLQFFADGEESENMGVDTDGDFGSDFADGLFDGDLENQQDAELETGESADRGLENQQPDGQQETPESQLPDKVNSSAGAREGALGQGGTQQGGQPPVATQEQQLVPLTYNGRQIMLPQAAVDEIGRALGANTIELLLKGMNYEKKNSREMAVLTQFAQASGMDLQQYVQALEQQRQQQELASEIDKLKTEFPSTEDGALREIAKSRIAARRNAEMQQAHAREAQATQLKNRVDQTVQRMQQKQQEELWDAYEQQTGIHDLKDIPPRVIELVQQGHTPMEAHWMHRNEQMQAELDKQKSIRQQQDNNRQSTVGSLTGAGADEDAFLSGLFGN